MYAGMKSVKEIHGENYTHAQLTMWARMIEAQQWKSKKKPTMICGSYSKEKSNTKGTPQLVHLEMHLHMLK